MIDNQIIVYRLRLTLLTLATALLPTGPVKATVVRFDTVLGSFDVRLFDMATPLYSANLSDYVNTNAYVGTFVHRSLPQFVVQGGGFFLDPDIWNPTHIATNPPVMNEPGISNIRTTVSMAKSDGNPNSATAEWFISVNHNTENLDNQNGGFTVFGSVLGNGMSVLDDINSRGRISVPGGLQNVPVLDFDKAIAQQNAYEEDVVMINGVTVVSFPDGDYTFDGSVDTTDLAKWESDYGRLKLIGGDFNDDREMDSADLSIWEGNYGTVSASVSYDDGDSNGDKFVDGFDFLNWQIGSGGTVDVAADGDGDAQITGLDFLQWQQNYGSSLPLSSVKFVPEPAALTLMLVGVVALRRQRRS